MTLVRVSAAPSRPVWLLCIADASASFASRSFRSSLCEKSAEGSIRGRLRKSINDLRIVASCRAHSSHSVRCICMPTSSIPGRVSSTNAKCFSRNSRQSMFHALRVRVQYPSAGYWFPNPQTCYLLHVRRNDLSEGITCPVQSRLHRSQIAVGDLGNLFVRLAFELS